MIARGGRFDLSSGCTLTGSPTPTGATCIEVKHSHKGDTFLTTTVLVPGDGPDSTLGIYPAPLPVTDTGDVTASASATEIPPSMETQPPSTTDTEDFPALSEATGIQTSLGSASTIVNGMVSVTGIPVSVPRPTMELTPLLEVSFSQLLCHRLVT
jgi:hypothetical protein